MVGKFLKGKQGKRKAIGHKTTRSKSGHISQNELHYNYAAFKKNKSLLTSKKNFCFADFGLCWEDYKAWSCQSALWCWGLYPFAGRRRAQGLESSNDLMMFICWVLLGWEGIACFSCRMVWGLCTAILLLGASMDACSNTKSVLLCEDGDREVFKESCSLGTVLEQHWQVQEKMACSCSKRGE